jgi:hypothetical protein
MCRGRDFQHLAIGVGHLYLRSAISFAISKRTAQSMASLCAYDGIREADPYEDLFQVHAASCDSVSSRLGSSRAGFRWNRNCGATAASGRCGYDCKARP